MSYKFQNNPLKKFSELQEHVDKQNCMNKVWQRNDKKETLEIPELIIW